MFGEARCAEAWKADDVPTHFTPANANAATSSHEELRPHRAKRDRRACGRMRAPHRKRLAHQTSSPPKPPGRNDMKHTS